MKLNNDLELANAHLLECLRANAACFRVLNTLAEDDPGIIEVLQKELAEAGVKLGFGKRCGDFLNEHGVKWPP